MTPAGDARPRAGSARGKKNDQTRPGACSGVSVVIVNWNGREDLVECLRSLRAQTDPDFEVIVVDNGSHDGSAKAALEEFPDVMLIETGSNLGFAEGCNRGIEAATQPWLLTLNNDTVADPNLLAVLRERIRCTSPLTGMIQVQMVFKDRPALLNSTGIVLFDNGLARDRDVGLHVAECEHEAEVFCPTAGAALYRRSMLEQTRLPAGFFDRDYFMYFEDVDLGWRCRIAGWHATYAPEARVRHGFQTSSQRHGPSFLRIQTRTNRLRSLIKNASKRFLLRSLSRTLWDVASLFWLEGPKAVPRLARAIGQSVRARAHVTRLQQTGRRAVERQWAIRRR
ncbi:MAG: glycosyltransferase family 2 protein [Proteobacteria bacterium]|nr:glycosyltransferase family 2 protein [Pseudomonadota bacterium]